MENELYDYLKIVNAISKVWSKLPNKAATIAVNFGKNSFRRQAWIGDRTENWAKRKHDDKNSRRRAILVKSGTLKRDLHKIRVTADDALIGTSTITKDYARIHNEGGYVNTTANVAAHKRKAHGRIRAGRKEKVKETIVREHSKKVRFRMPRRRFIGASPVMDKQIERMMIADIVKAAKSASVNN